jgi:hypothetical protein
MCGLAKEGRAKNAGFAMFGFRGLYSGSQEEGRDRHWLRYHVW